MDIIFQVSVILTVGVAQTSRNNTNSITVAVANSNNYAKSKHCTTTHFSQAIDMSTIPRMTFSNYALNNTKQLNNNVRPRHVDLQPVT